MLACIGCKQARSLFESGDDYYLFILFGAAMCALYMYGLDHPAPRGRLPAPPSGGGAHRHEALRTLPEKL